jgi:ComF family protein
MLSQALHKTASLARGLYDDFKEFLSPSSCLCCGRDRDFPDPLLCPACLNSLRQKNIGAGPICPYCGRPKGTNSTCNLCSTGPLDLFYWGYYEDELKECILQFKFHGAIDLGKRLSQLALESVGERLTSQKYDLVVPIPLHRGREKERLFNQSELIAQEIANFLNIEIRPDILSRVKPTRQQAKLEEKDRWNNVKDAFVVSQDLIDSISGKRILLVDDIVTTGATIHEASRPILAAAPKRLDIFSLAYAK